jgi:hypothetical protein
MQVSNLKTGSADASMMRTYRIFFLGQDGHIKQPPEIVECPDDQTAVEMAQQLLDGRTVEIWESSRLVARLAPD